MRKALLGVAGATVLVLAGAAIGSAQVNCGIVNKDLKMGRTAQDIAERMMISTDDVKKCEEEAKKAAPAAGAPAAGAPAAAAPAGDTKGDMK
jgi:hypothetical protein